MATVKEMIEWLNTLPQDAEVECGIGLPLYSHADVERGVEKMGSYDAYTSMDSVDIKSCEVLDFTSEEHRRKYPRMAGKVIVMLYG